MLGKRLKYKKANKFITRFRLNNQFPSNPQQYAVPEATYFNRIDMEKSVLSAVNTKTQNISNTSKEKQQNRSITHLQKLSASKQILKSQHKSTPGITQSFNNTKMSKFTSSQIQNPFKPKDSLMSATLRQIQAIKQEKQKQKKNKEIYLSYLEYQQIVHSKQSKHNFLEKIAKKNDKRFDTQPDPAHYKSEKTGLTLSKKELRQVSGSSLQPIKYSRNRRIKTQISNEVKTNDKSSIISSNLGILSNDAILNKLEQQWYQQQKKQKLIAKDAQQQDSELDDLDDLTLSMKQTSKINNILSKRSEIDDRGKQMNFKNIGHQNIQKHLQKILELDQYEKKHRQHNYSQGEQYRIHEAKLMRFDNVYVSKKFQLKHKFDWR